MKVVLDTNVWLDWLLFDDPRVAPLRAAVEAGTVEVLADEACEAELARVLTYRFYRETLPPGDQARHLDVFRRSSNKLEIKKQTRPGTLRCADPDDQKFLDLAVAAGAQALLTRDEALLRLARRAPFRILRPEELQLG